LPGMEVTTTFLCAAGYYCPAGSMIDRTESRRCREGYFCAAGSFNETICPAGTYQNQPGQSACLDCPQGYFCQAGSINFENNICPVGSYCPVKSPSPKPCPIGTYNKLTKRTSPRDCLACDPGSICSSTAEGQTEVVGVCPAG